MQDGVPIDDITWIRYRKSKSFLKVKSAQPSDTGVYSCKGINGFGTEDARIEVVIVGEQSIQAKDYLYSILSLFHSVLDPCVKERKRCGI